MDQVSDTGSTELYRMSQLYGAPVYVKTASAAELSGEGKKLPPDCYGDPRNLHYPLHTKAATWASYGFFLGNAATYRPVDAGVIEERILHAGRAHGIERTLGQLKEAVAKNRPVELDELPDELFAVGWQNADGSKERHLPMRNRLETVKAAEYLHTHRDLFPYDYRRAAAEKIREKVASYGALLPEGLGEFIEKQAGFGTCASADAVELLLGRVSASRKGPGGLSAVQIEMAKFAEALHRSPAAVRDVEIRVKVASVVDGFDREAGLTSLVRDGLLPRVEDVLFELTREKLASAAGAHTQTIIGSIYHLADVECLKLAAVRDVLGDDIADALTADGVRVSSEKAAAIIPTLDRGSASLFEQLMEDAGLTPAAKQASQAVKVENAFLRDILATIGPAGC